MQNGLTAAEISALRSSAMTPVLEYAEGAAVGCGGWVTGQSASRYTSELARPCIDWVGRDDSLSRHTEEACDPANAACASETER